MEASIRRKLIGTDLIGTAWSNNTYQNTEDLINQENPTGTFVAMGVYPEGQGRCDKSFAELHADTDGKMSLVIRKDALKKLGITLEIKD